MNEFPLNRRQAVSATLAVLLSPVVGLSQQSKKSEVADDQTGLSAWVDVYAEIAAGHDFRLRNELDTKLEFQSKPIQVYSHPSGLAGTHGAFFVWTRAGRPQIIGSIWSYDAANDRRTIVHEFDSFALSPVADIAIAQGTWKQQHIVVPKLVPEAPPPAANARARLSQMKAIAQRFEGFTTSRKPEVQLRMLARPVYQFQAGEGEVRDVAMFCFFADWDPEIVLLIESSMTPEGERWHYSAGRFNIVPMWLNYDGAEIWRVEQEPSTGITFGDPEGPFFAVHDVAARPRRAPSKQEEK